ncbi:LysR family transcriptional regulator [Microbulbifer sp. Q7]|uniref:LysR family transcriptional regulator n=1 Tax=Microbulbifer sp. Q7 TaxID=1785091 RepID=UPI00083037BE|nr:LysR family transcriptional regulator [Microbulbifer sp. Q7]
METEDLEKFLVIAATQNLQRAADRLDATPGGLSKVLSRLERSLDCRLFDRVGKKISINDSGRRLQQRAAEIVALARATRAEFGSVAQGPECRVAAPAMLQLRWAGRMQRQLAEQLGQSCLSMTSAYESVALKMLVRGEVDCALVTDAVSSQIGAGFSSRNIGTITMAVAASSAHPLVVGQADPMHRPVSVTTQTLRAYAFAAPRISPFGGDEQGIGSDGWREDKLPRRVSVVVNDYGALCNLVREAQVLAYLPLDLINEIGAVRIDVVDCPYECQRDLLAVWRGSRHGWLDQLMESL